MSSDVEICNLALSHARQDNTVTSLADDNTTEAIRLRRIFYPTLNRMSQKFPWHFSETTIELAVLDKEAKGDFEYVYSIPSNVLSVTKVSDSVDMFKSYDSTDGMNIFKVMPSDDGLTQELHSKVELAYALIRKTVISVSNLDALFVDAFAYELAKQLANLYGVSANEKKDIANEAAIAMSDAMENSALQEDVEFNEYNTYVESRGVIGEDDE